jgi:DNA-binding transcriptional MerR regulator
MKLKSAAIRKILSIGDAAAALGISASTLRFYERIGVVDPCRAGRNKNRLYLPQDIEQIRKYRASLGKT